MVDAGDVLGGRYELTQHLGGGGMAEVYRAVDRELHREVAVKVLSARRVPDVSMVDRFRREARSAASLNHLNVVSVHDTGQDDDAHYIVMELVDGPTLDDVVREEGPLDPERAAAIAVEVCAGLATAHARGIVHRDVKPSNIMFDPSGTLKVSDFGIARAGTDATVTASGTVYGSVPFIAPEVARGDAVDARADVYGLGCVLFAMLTGSPPFQADEPLGIVYQHLHAIRPRPSSVEAGVPGDLDAIVVRCLAVDPDERYASVDELRQDLEAFLRNETPPVAFGGAVIAETQLLGPVDETVAIGPASEPPTVSGVPPRRRIAAEHSAPTGDGWGARRWLFAVAVVVAVLVAWALLGPVLGGSPGRAPTGDTTARPTVPPTELTEGPASDPVSPPPTFEVPDAPPSVEDAVGDLLGLIATGANTGAIDPEAARDLTRTSRDLVRHLERGREEPAGNQIDELRDRVAAFAEEGRVEADVAASIIDVLDRLAAILGAGAEDGEDGANDGNEGGGDGDGEDGDGD